MKLESPLLNKVVAEALQDVVLAVLRHRFKAVGREVTKQLRAILDKKKLIQLNIAASRCDSLEAFREAMVK